ncbi:MAG: peptidoglycan D,D-transpeptidase FtsI family protein [Campylobacteraceae bacterium]
MTEQNYNQQMKNKFTVFFILVVVGFLIFISILIYWTKIDRRLPQLQTSETSLAIRGNILSADGYTLATSQKLFKVMVDTRNISPDKKDLFIKLYTIYSGDDPKAVKERLDSRKGNVVLSYRIDSKTAEHLQTLARRLYKFGVFTSFEDPRTGIATPRGMSIVESGEVRVYPYKDALTPVLGYVKKIEQDAITKVEGVKGLERYYEDRLSPIQDAYLVGYRDISNAIILNKDARLKQKIDGQNIQISIPIKLQKSIENILDIEKKNLEAKETLAIVMKSVTGEIVAFASSNRYSIGSIKKDEYSHLNIAAAEYSYEPGSVMKPIIYATLLRENKVDPKEIVNVHGGRYTLGKYRVTDEVKKDWLAAEDVITYSSNIGMLQLAQRLDGAAYYRGLVDFGFGENSGVDLSKETKGYLQSVQRLNSDVYKGTISYGYGISVNFLQLIRAFNVFNNDGKIVTPKIGIYVVDKNGTKNQLIRDDSVEIISPKIANEVRRLLTKVIMQGSGTKAFVKGVDIGGKTGTAHISAQGSYHSFYNSSFIGYANDDEGDKYTIGILIIEPNTAGRRYFGSQSAAPIFAKVVTEMIEQGYIKQNIAEVKE